MKVYNSFVLLVESSKMLLRFLLFVVYHRHSKISVDFYLVYSSLIRNVIEWHKLNWTQFERMPTDSIRLQEVVKNKWNSVEIVNFSQNEKLYGEPKAAKFATKNVGDRSFKLWPSFPIFFFFSWGQCYDHNCLRFRQFSPKNWRFFKINNAPIYAKN
jgi:hypothetical protein